VFWLSSSFGPQVLQRFRHPSLARLYGYHLSTLLPPKNCVHYLLYEYAARGSLEGLLITLEGRQQLNFSRRLHILLDVAQGLHFLHTGAATATAAKDESFASSSPSNVDYTFCHRDVKSANVCITADYRAKIIDCGLGKLLPKDEVAESKLLASWARSSAQLNSGGGDKLGTPAYRDPGYEHGDYRYGTWCDIFSYGVVMAELITGTLSSSSSTATATVAAEASRGGTVHRKYVYRDKNGKTKRDLRGDIDDVILDAPGAYLQVLCDLCLQCLDDDVGDRPNAFAVLGNLQRLSVQVVYGVDVLAATAAVEEKASAGKDCCSCSLCGRNDCGPTAGLSAASTLFAATTYRPFQGSSPAPTRSSASWRAVIGATASRT
jgi:serine/threonine protein kinase